MSGAVRLPVRWVSGCPVKSGESCPVEFLSLCAVFCCTQICPVKCPVCHRTLSGSVSGGARPIQVYVRWLSGDCPVDCPADCPVPLVCQTGMPSCRSHLFLRVRTYPTVCKLPQSHRTLRQTHRTAPDTSPDMKVLIICVFNVSGLCCAHRVRLPVATFATNASISAAATCARTVAIAAYDTINAIAAITLLAAIAYGQCKYCNHINTRGINCKHGIHCNHCTTASAEITSCLR